MTREQIKIAKDLQTRDWNYKLIAKKLGVEPQEVWDAIATKLARRLREARECSR